MAEDEKDETTRLLTPSTDTEDDEICTTDYLSTTVHDDSNTGTILGKLRFKALRFIDSFGMQIVSVTLVLVDVAMTIVAVSTSNPTYEFRSQIASDVILGVFVFEMLTRIFGMGIFWYVRSGWEVCDFMIIVSCIILTVTVDPLDHEYSRLATAARLFRIIRLIPLFQRMVFSARRVTSENKRRYRRDGYDLDLTFVTDRIIAMSVPSAGWLSLYRNPINEVARFFNTRYPHRYRIYNLCPEIPYDHLYFHNRVVVFDVEDHNVPSLLQMCALVSNAAEFLSQHPEHVVAVHCKGGKGRTGTIVCALLLYTNPAVFTSSDIARNHFAVQRTNLMLGSKFQGVQTPSQSRYIDYFAEISKQYNFVVPESPSYYLNKIILKHIPERLRHSKPNILVEVFCNRQPLVRFTPFHDETSIVRAKSSDDLSTVEMIFYGDIAPLIYNDVKVRFTSPDLPVYYDDVSFFFSFHTLFVKNGVFQLKRDYLDNPHFRMFHSVYPPEFTVRLELSKE